MVFLEFIPTESNHVKTLFVGSSVQKILDDTKNGTEFGGKKFQSYNKISEEAARQSGSEWVDKGIKAVRDGKTHSYML